MTIPSVSNQYKPIQEVFNASYLSAKSTKFSRKSSLKSTVAFCNLGNAIATYNSNSSSLNSAKDVLSGDVNIFNIAQTTSYNANVALEKANETLSDLFNKVASANAAAAVNATASASTPSGVMTPALVSPDGVVVPGTPSAPTVTALNGTTSQAAAYNDRSILNQELTPEQIKEAEKFSQSQNSVGQSELAQLQYRLQLAQQEADQAQIQAAEQSNVLAKAEDQLNNDRTIVSNRESVVEVSGSDVDVKQDVFNEVQDEKTLPNGSFLNLEI